MIAAMCWDNVYVEGDGASGGSDFAETLQRTLGDLARSTQDIQVMPVCVNMPCLNNWTVQDSGWTNCSL